MQKKKFLCHKHKREKNLENGSPDIYLLILLYNKPLSTLHDGKRGAHFVYSICDLCLCTDIQETLFLYW